MNPKNRRRERRFTSSGWDPVANWYDGWVGQDGSDHHRRLAIPALLDLLLPHPGEAILDIGSGQGVLAPFVAERGAAYTGVDVSARLVKTARRRHGQSGRFILADARDLAESQAVRAASFDAAVFLLSIQDMNPLLAVLQSAGWALKPGGRLVILMTHPCFRIPRQSGWGHDAKRKLRYRRIDRYLTPLRVPMKPYPGQAGGATISFHRPLNEYVNGLAACGLLIDQMAEIPTHRAASLADQEIPLFLALRAWKQVEPG